MKYYLLVFWLLISTRAIAQPINEPQYVLEPDGLETTRYMNQDGKIFDQHGNQYQVTGIRIYTISVIEENCSELNLFVDDNNKLDVPPGATIIQGCGLKKIH